MLYLLHQRSTVTVQGSLIQCGVETYYYLNVCRLLACKCKAKGHIVNKLLNLNVPSSLENLNLGIAMLTFSC